MFSKQRQKADVVFCHSEFTQDTGPQKNRAIKGYYTKIIFSNLYTH